MHKRIPFIGTREVERRASVFQTKQSRFYTKRRWTQITQINMKKRIHLAVESRQSDGAKRTGTVGISFY